MEFSDERYVRLYVRDTVTWKSLSFDARATLALLLRKVDRAGILDIGEEDAATAVSSIIDGPPDRIGPAMTQLISKGVIEHCGAYIVLPRFAEAQEARASDKQRQAEHRARRVEQARAKALGLTDVTKRDKRPAPPLRTDMAPPLNATTRGPQPPVTKRDVGSSADLSQNVTGHTASMNDSAQVRGPNVSHAVTPSQTVPYLADQRDLQTRSKTRNLQPDSDLPARADAHAHAHAREEQSIGQGGIPAPGSVDGGVPRPTAPSPGLCEVQIHVTEYVPSPEVAAYASALGLTAVEWDACKSEFMTRVTRPRGYPNYFHHIICSFIETKSRKKNHGRNPTRRNGSGVIAIERTTDNFDGPLMRKSLEQTRKKREARLARKAAEAAAAGQGQG